jgi:replicative DNA helicase
MNRTELITEIKDRLSCKDYLQRSKSGLYCCPYCGSGTGPNKSGALKVYPSNTWTCHACKRSGDVLDLLQIVNACDFAEAVEIGAAALALPVDGADRKNGDFSGFYERKDKYPTEDSKQAVAGDLERSNGKSAVDYTAYYATCRQRLTDPAAVSYLSARGISTQTAAALGVGYDPAADPAGNPGAADGEPKAHPAARLIIPTGPAHYVGRSIDPDTPKQWAKLNSRGGSPGIFNAAALERDGLVFVTEGAFDALSFAECGAAAVATNSTANAGRVAALLQDHATPPAIVIAFDNDPDPATHERTQKAAEGLKSALQAQEIPCVVLDIGRYTKAGEKDVNDILRRDKSEVIRMIENAAQAVKQEATKDDITAFLERVQGEQYRPIATGLQFFDELLDGGPIRQSLLLLMAAPGTGKTTIVQQVAEEMAERKQPAIYLNFEMSREQMIAKAVSRRLYENKRKEYAATDILQGYKWPAELRAAILQDVEKYRAQIYPYLRYNPDGISSDLDTLQDYLRRTGDRAKAAGEPAPAVIVDYLHLISSSRGLDTAELIKQAVTGLKQYAVDYGTFVIAIVATNRTSNTAGRITLESGRDTSNIEYTADYQISLNYYDIDQGTVKADDPAAIADLQAEPWRRMILRVLKNRFGQPGKTAKVYYGAKCNYFFPKRGFIPEGAKPFDPPAAKPVKRL